MTNQRGLVPRNELSKADLWALGIIAPWYLYDYQISVYDFLVSTRWPVFEATRRFGKTTTKLVDAQEKSRRQERRVTRWCEPLKEQARNIVMPEMERIQGSCPSKLRARFYRTDSFYEFPTTGSRIYLLGVNEDRGEGARGSYAHEIVADEVGFWVEPQYIINEVLMPQLLTTGGDMACMSTPPRDLAHYWYTIVERAARDGRLIQRNFDTVTSIKESEKEAFILAMGGRESTAVRRELYLERVADAESLVIPEFKPDLVELDDDHPAPAFFDAYVAGDSGADDNTAILFGYYDFAADTVVIEDEYVVAGKTTEDIVAAAKVKEEALWKDLKPFRRVYDADKQLLLDICTTHRYSVVLPDKADKIAAINSLRTRVGAGKFKVKKRCRNLLRQLQVGMWRDEKHSDFERSKELGHLDAIAAAIYFNRSIIVSRNPYPHNAGVSHQTHFIPPGVGSHGEKEALTRAFSSSARRLGARQS
jgi:hypothetical protein